MWDRMERMAWVWIWEMRDSEKPQAAAISAHKDAAIGDLVADAMEKVGKEREITV